MQQVQFISVTPEQLQNAIIEGIKSQLESLKTHFQPPQPKTYLSRAEVSKMLNVSFVTLNKWNKNGKLKISSPANTRQKRYNQRYPADMFNYDVGIFIKYG